MKTIKRKNIKTERDSKFKNCTITSNAMNPPETKIVNNKIHLNFYHILGLPNIFIDPLMIFYATEPTLKAKPGIYRIIFRIIGFPHREKINWVFNTRFAK